MWPVSDLLLIGFVVVLMLAAATTAWRQFQHRQARDRFVKDLTTAAAAFRTCIRQTGIAPETANSGVVPAGMAPFLSAVNWTEPTPVGGSYRWLGNRVNKSEGETVAAGRIEITAFPPGRALALTTADLLEIDREIDDGDLSTGDFRSGFNGWPVLSVRATH